MDTKILLASTAKQNSHPLKKELLRSDIVSLKYVCVDLSFSYIHRVTKEQNSIWVPDQPTAPHLI